MTTAAMQPDIVRDYMQLVQSMEPNWPPVMYQQVEGGILQRDYGVATVLYATALGTFDGQAAHTQGGDADTDGGEVQIEAGDARLFGVQENTIANSTGAQTRVTLTDAQISSVPTPAATGANPGGPQIPAGRNPIVFVQTTEPAPWTTARNGRFFAPVTPKRGWTQTQARG